MTAKRILGALSALLALLIFALAVFPASPALAVSQAETDALEEQRDALKAERESMQADIDALKNEQAGILEQKRALDEQNEVYRQELELIEEQVSLYTRLVDEKAAELEEATAAEEEQLATYKQHVRAMEENGKYTYLSIIFGSRSLSELMSNLDMIGEIMEADKRIYDQYTAAREKAEEIKAEYEVTLEQLSEKQDEYEAEKVELEAKITEASAMIEQLEAEISTNYDLYLEVLAQEEALESDIQNKIAELERQEAASSITSTGSYIWPLPGYSPGSAYGWRMHPIFNEMRFHAGEDIGAPSGTPILAADSGVASVYPDNGNGYGNYIMINHGGGRVTLYAHMSAFAISGGATVTQGQVIGYVGSTGNSTGPHLHFEVRVNGATTDPKQYFNFG